MAVVTDGERAGTMRPLGENLRIFLHRAPIDWRRGRNGLAAVLKEDPFASGAQSVFVGKSDDSPKILTWEKNGFGLWWKKLESAEKYHWPRMVQQEVVTAPVEQLNWLLDGYDVWTQTHQMLKVQHVS